MEAYILEWLNLLLRWAHLIVGIAWIGSSFYFVWLDLNLNVPPRDPEDEAVAGDLWAVHGGGFYHAQKYRVAPGELPDPLHWFKWEAYTTWLTGFALLVLIYYLNAEVYLIDKAVADITPFMAIATSIGLLLASWIGYDLLCRSGLSDSRIALLGFLLLAVVVYLVSHLFSGRGAYIQVGAMLGTIMVANVFFVIIPGQRELVRAKQRGEEPDPLPGLRGKQRSVHNNYLTLPVLFVMLSPHYPITYAHEYNWLLLIVIFSAGALIRHFFNLKNQGRPAPVLVIIALLLLGLAAFIAIPKSASESTPTSVSNPAPESISASADAPQQAATTQARAPVSFAEVREVITQRCNICHSATPNHPTAPVAPRGIMFDTPEQIRQWTKRIHASTVTSKTMPLANLTQITEEERELIARWYQAGAPVE
ncbi:MAG: urate hydroxylase PuuD [Gammaproteobacteria bacterium]|nr:urate hydroxylase PuuD [Gammaproteobacteria bacterium]